jgi:hypothetical protein
VNGLDVSIGDLVRQANELSERIDEGVKALARAAKGAAEAEHTYRLQKARAWVEHTDGTVPERTAAVDGATAGLRRDRDLAEASKLAALEALRSRRQQLSAVQSIAAAVRSELDLAGKGPA